MKETYRLFVVAPETIADGEPYYLITPNYCLLYTKNEAPDRSVELTEIKSLPMLARDWLGECIDEIRRRFLQEHQEEVLAKAKTFTEALGREIEAELAKEKDKHE